MQIVYRCALLLLAIIAWLLPTMKILNELNYFLKTGIYNSAPLFYSPRVLPLLVVITGATAIAVAAADKRARLHALASALATGLIGVVVALLVIYCWIYADLMAAKFWRVRLSRTMVPASVFEVVTLAIMYLVATKLVPALLRARREASLFYAAVATFSCTGMAKAALLILAPSVPLPGLSQLICDGPCL